MILDNNQQVCQAKFHRCKWFKWGRRCLLITTVLWSLASAYITVCKRFRPWERRAWSVKVHTTNSTCTSTNRHQAGEPTNMPGETKRVSVQFNTIKRSSEESLYAAQCSLPPPCIFLPATVPSHPRLSVCSMIQQRWNRLVAWDCSGLGASLVC